jgi:hypothetical protein
MTTEFRAPSSKAVARVLLVVVALLLALSTAGQGSKYLLGHPDLKGFVPTFYVDYESNVPTWYSSCALLLAALLLGMIAAAKATTADQFRWHWGLLSVVFVGLSADEIAGFHELPIDAMRAAFHLSGVLFYPWVILGGAFALAMAAATWRMLWSLPVCIRREMFVAAAVFSTGALGIEMLSGLQASRYGEENFTYALIVTFEEGCEMLGVVIYIHALLEYIHTELGPMYLAIGRPPVRR